MEMGLPPAQGLYDPRNEHDACGVGFIANVKGAKSNAIVAQGLQILVNLDHRGAVGADPLLGDGAGILIQIPDAYLRAENVLGLADLVEQRGVVLHERSRVQSILPGQVVTGQGQAQRGHFGGAEMLLVQGAAQDAGALGALHDVLLGEFAEGGGNELELGALFGEKVGQGGLADAAEVALAELRGRAVWVDRKSVV